MPTTRAAAKQTDAGTLATAKSAKSSEKKPQAGDKPEQNGKRTKTEEEKPIKKAKLNSGKGATIKRSPERAAEIPSNIIEKGIIYFLTRGRVDTEDPKDVSDLQRTYFVLRSLPKDAKIGDGVIPDDPVSRLIAVPKKSLPKGHHDRFMVFVEKTKTKMSQLKETFFDGSEKVTKTRGVRKTPPVTVIGEGVYAITVTGRTSHLAYMLAIPSEPGEVQKALGVRTKGSFVISLKNPTTKGPPNTQLPQSPDFPKSIMDEFRGLRWMPIQKPEHLDYPNSQLLLVGEGQDKFGNALAKEEPETKNGQLKSPEEELEKLEDEEELRIEHLHGDSSVFDDLHLHQKDYPPLKSTW